MAVFFKFLLRNIFPGGAVLSTLLMAYFDGFYDWENPPLTLTFHSKEYSLSNPDITFLVLAAIVILFSASEAIRREFERAKSNALKSDNLRLQVENDEMTQRLMSYFNPVIRDFLQRIYEDLDFNENERITAYKVEDDCFWPIGRVSENHEFKEYRRNSYPKNQGCIGKAWREKEAHDNRIPEDHDKWCERQQNKWDLPPLSAENIRMKSRSIFALRIDKTCDEKNALVVIVFESLLPQKISLKNIEKIKSLLEENQVELERMFCDYDEYGPSQQTSNWN